MAQQGEVEEFTQFKDRVAIGLLLYNMYLPYVKFLIYNITKPPFPMD